MTKGNKREIISKNIKLIISIIVLLIMLVAATVAWYVLSNSASIENFSSKMSEWDFIVSKTSNGEAINENDTFELNIANFNNVENGKMAPGTYGYITLYIRASSLVTGYAISLDDTNLTFKVPNTVDLATEGVTLSNSTNNVESDNSTIDCTELISKHFKFYSDEECTKEITKDSPYIGILQPNVEQPVKIYWKWLYNGTASAESITDEAEKETFMTNWDNEDNFILKYKEHIQGNVKVTACGTQAEPNATNSVEASATNSAEAGEGN